MLTESDLSTMRARLLEMPRLALERSAVLAGAARPLSRQNLGELHLSAFEDLEKAVRAYDELILEWDQLKIAVRAEYEEEAP